MRVLRDNPVTTATFVIGVILGAVAAVQLELGPEGMSMTKQVLGGALMGAWLAMFPLGFRLFE